MLCPDVLGLLHPTPSGSEIPYAAGRAAPTPLSFGRVNGGRPITSQALLFRLPIELLQEVVANLNTADLKSLALVDRDCRQVARSRLFASVVLDYSNEKYQLLEELSREARARRDNGGTTDSPSIGACIRHLTVSTRPSAVANRHGIDQAIDHMGVRERYPMSKEIIEFYYETYLPAISRVLRFSLPNLDELEWKDSIMIPEHTLTAIACSPIRHLGLHRVMLRADCEYPLPPREQQKWALRSLDLVVIPNIYDSSSDWPNRALADRVVSRFCTSVLKEAAPTLERLLWNGHMSQRQSFGGSVIRFPRLRTLLLDTFSQVADDTVLESFFPADAESCALRSVSINIMPEHWREFLARRGHIRGLEALRLHPADANHKAPVAAFLSANPQLKSLAMLTGTPEHLSTTLLPFLALNFKLLTSLVVSFTSAEIPPSAVAAIGRISSLTSLWIVAAIRFDELERASEDVPTIIALSPLRNLARLALSRGQSGNTATTTTGYRDESASASYHILGPTDIEGRRRWEDLHKERVRQVVEVYVRTFRRLEWVYMSELVHRIVGNVIVLEEGGRRQYSPGRVWEGLY